ncbi:MAG TPA: sigma-54 dependent transcriptional regulator [Terriglobales bacterium]|nr:sigma-54 dependent transcriptional regulator [Terriglobales bacterium]
MNCPESKPCSILVVDDDANLARTLGDFLSEEGYSVEVAFSAAEALALQERNPQICAAMVDLVMPLADGLELMTRLHQRDPDLAVIIMTGYGTIETAVDAIKRGAEDYITKPFDRQAVRTKVGRLMELFELRERVARLEAGLRTSCPPFEAFVFVSLPMQKVIERARAAAATNAAVLIVGETGTGKEMLARAIHGASRRVAGPFIPVNCGALPHELVESELFGFRRGAFTGAYADTPGVFAAASGGTVFLDEIGEMPKDVQVKLLRILQEGELRPVGSPKPLQVDVRVVAATNRSLAALRSECLREDLYFRIATVVIEIPALRTRMEDVIALAHHITRRLSTRYGREITLARAAMDLLLGYSFPGNVRELENVLESAAALSSEDPQTIGEKDLRPLLQQGAASELKIAADNVLSLDHMERAAIEQALRVCGGNRTRAASLLGISRDTLHRKLREFKAGA